MLRGVLAGVGLAVLALGMQARVTVAHAAAPTGRDGTLQQYWDGHADWTFVRKWGRDELGQAHPEWGAAIKVVGSTWYLFNRYAAGPFAACNGRDNALGTEVRRSTDQGRTWSPPTPIVAPTGRAGDPFACAATDGSVWYDASSNRWHFLFQCLGTTGGWNGCERERAGSSPMGAFADDPPGGSNPVIDGGDLWDRICDVATDDCVALEGGVPGRVHDEGTFDIFDQAGGYFWVAFHGYSSPRGYRGIAKTSDFVHWIAGDSARGVPADAFLDENDASGWRESWGPGGSIGAGAGSIVKEGPYWYDASEFADGDLACIGGSKWDWGLFRTTSLTSTSWAQPPRGNPFLYNSDQWGAHYCTAAYTSLFRDGGKTYLLSGQWVDDPDTEGMYLFRLDRNADDAGDPINLLSNGDFWTADTGGGWTLWPTNPPGTFKAVRHEDFAPDQTPYAEFSCGTGTCPGLGQSFYQESAVPSSLRGQTVQFGGKLAAEGGGSAEVLVKLYQFDSGGRLVADDGYTAPLTNSWTNFNGSATLTSTASRVRYQLYPLTPDKTLCADDLYVSRLDGAPQVVDTRHRTCGINYAPKVTASGSPASGKSPLTVAFAAAGNDDNGDQLSYRWDFGDGGTATDQNPTHTYLDPGTYTARVTVTDPAGASASDEVEISATHGWKGGKPPQPHEPM